MSHQSKPRGVEASGDQLAHRQQCEAGGDEFEEILREEITKLAHACKVMPWPQASFLDAQPQRHRPLSLKKFGTLIVALAKDPSLPGELLPAFGNRLLAWICSLQPRQGESLAAIWEAETRAQADADVAQARALRAIETRDLAAVESAIDETTQNLTHTQRLLLRLTTARREIIAARRSSLHAIRA